MEGLELPDSSMRAVANRLKYYIDVERKEEGFDLSPARIYSGQFRVRNAGGVGTFHYNSIQDRYLQRYLDNPQVRKRLLNMGAVHIKTLEEMDRVRKRMATIARRPKIGTIGVSERQMMNYQEWYETNVLMESAAGLIVKNIPVEIEKKGANYQEDYSSCDELSAINVSRPPSGKGKDRYHSPKALICANCQAEISTPIQQGTIDANSFSDQYRQSRSGRGSSSSPASTSSTLPHKRGTARPKTALGFLASTSSLSRAPLQSGKKGQARSSSGPSPSLQKSNPHVNFAPESTPDTHHNDNDMPHTNEGSKVLQSNGRHRSVFIYTDPVTTNAGTQTLVHTKSQTEQSEVPKLERCPPNRRPQSSVGINTDPVPRPPAVRNAWTNNEISTMVSSLSSKEHTAKSENQTPRYKPRPPEELPRHSRVRASGVRSDLPSSQNSKKLSDPPSLRSKKKDQHSNQHPKKLFESDSMSSFFSNEDKEPARNEPQESKSDLASSHSKRESFLPTIQSDLPFNGHSNKLSSSSLSIQSQRDDLHSKKFSNSPSLRSERQSNSSSLHSEKKNRMPSNQHSDSSYLQSQTSNRLSSSLPQRSQRDDLPSKQHPKKVSDSPSDMPSNHLHSKRISNSAPKQHYSKKSPSLQSERTPSQMKDLPSNNNPKRPSNSPSHQSERHSYSPPLHSDLPSNQHSKRSSDSPSLQLERKELPSKRHSKESPDSPSLYSEMKDLPSNQHSNKVSNSPSIQTEMKDLPSNIYSNSPSNQSEGHSDSPSDLPSSQEFKIIAPSPLPLNLLPVTNEDHSVKETSGNEPQNPPPRPDVLSNLSRHSKRSTSLQSKMHSDSPSYLNLPSDSKKLSNSPSIQSGRQSAPSLHPEITDLPLSSKQTFLSSLKRILFFKKTSPKNPVLVTLSNNKDKPVNKIQAHPPQESPGHPHTSSVQSDLPANHHLSLPVNSLLGTLSNNEDHLVKQTTGNEPYPPQESLKASTVNQHFDSPSPQSQRNSDSPSLQSQRHSDSPSLQSQRHSDSPSLHSQRHFDSPSLHSDLISDQPSKRLSNSTYRPSNSPPDTLSNNENHLLVVEEPPRKEPPSLRSERYSDSPSLQDLPSNLPETLSNNEDHLVEETTINEPYPQGSCTSSVQSDLPPETLSNNEDHLVEETTRNEPHPPQGSPRSSCTSSVQSAPETLSNNEDHLVEENRNEHPPQGFPRSSCTSSVQSDLPPDEALSNNEDHLVEETTRNNQGSPRYSCTSSVQSDLPPETLSNNEDHLVKETTRNEPHPDPPQESPRYSHASSVQSDQPSNLPEDNQILVEKTTRNEPQGSPRYSCTSDMPSNQYSKRLSDSPSLQSENEPSNNETHSVKETTGNEPHPPQESPRERRPILLPGEDRPTPLNSDEVPAIAIVNELSSKDAYVESVSPSASEISKQEFKNFMKEKSIQRMSSIGGESTGSLDEEKIPSKCSGQ